MTLGQAEVSFSLANDRVGPIISIGYWSLVLCLNVYKIAARLADKPPLTMERYLEARSEELARLLRARGDGL